jgi:hypothetical protein
MPTLPTLPCGSTKSSGIPLIPAYHALGAARHIQPVVNLNNVSVDKRAHDKYAKKFVWSVPLNIKELKEIELIVPKTARGKVGSKEHLMYQKLATKAIDTKFGVPLHLITVEVVLKRAIKQSISSFSNNMSTIYLRSKQSSSVLWNMI